MDIELHQCVLLIGYSDHEGRYSPGQRKGIVFHCGMGLG